MLHRSRGATAALLTTILLSTVVAAAGTSAESELRRVADAVLAQTSRVLVDRSTGEIIRDSSARAPKPEVTVESKFNAWFYQTALLADGMRRTAEVLRDDRYRGYGDRNLDFLYSHLPYFARQHAAAMTAAPAGDGKLSPIGFHFRIDALWHTGLAPVVIERYARSRDADYEPYLARVRAFLAKNPRFDDGLRYRPRKGAMTDDPYMTVPFLIGEWRLTGDARFLDDAVQQVSGTHARLFNREMGLFRHFWDLKTERPAGEFWGRGNGWMVLAYVALLDGLPTNHLRRPEILAEFAALMRGLCRHQNPLGGWHQLIDRPESWIETSGTAMFTYGLARGVNEGWLEGAAAADALRGWQALAAKITADGDVIDVCGSTDVGDVAYYLKRPRLQGDLHGFGSLLLAGAEIVRLQRSGKF